MERFFKYIINRFRFWFWWGLSYFGVAPLVSNPIFKYPRNQECFCASGRKFKKCCEPRMPKLVTRREAKTLQKSMDKITRDMGRSPFLDKARVR